MAQPSWFFLWLFIARGRLVVLSRCVHDVKLAQLQPLHKLAFLLAVLWVSTTSYTWSLLRQTWQTKRHCSWHWLQDFFQLDLGLDLLED